MKKRTGMSKRGARPGPSGLAKDFAIFCIMGGVFMIMEVLFRVLDYPVPSGLIDMSVMSPYALVGYTSFWMFLVGGLSGFLIGQLNFCPAVSSVPYRLQVLLGGLIIVVLELVSGLILNVWLGFHLWDYSGFAFNFMGQICLAASALWVALTPLAMWLDDVLRYYMGDQPKPDRLLDYYLDIFRT
ncbi:MAG: putative ABC transporter permease [Spirochaetes bacterium]|nr:putative ABC transporter permease [Spirochaetota bacterium]MBU1081501.1 putative ABC transporter permease [Spirochaetota bacterium]